MDILVVKLGTALRILRTATETPFWSLALEMSHSGKSTPDPQSRPLHNPRPTKKQGTHRTLIDSLGEPP